MGFEHCTFFQGNQDLVDIYAPHANNTLLSYCPLHFTIAILVTHVLTEWDT